MFDCFADDVEFEVSSDRRTGKPIAVKLVKIKPEILPEERINGQVSGYDVCFLCIQLPSFTLGGTDPLSMHANYIQNSVTLNFFFFCYSNRNLEFQCELFAPNSSSRQQMLYKIEMLQHDIPWWFKLEVNPQVYSRGY